MKNGNVFDCIIANDWEAHKEHTQMLVNKINAFEEVLPVVMANLAYLQKLEGATTLLSSLNGGIRGIELRLQLLQTDLVAAATGKKHIPETMVAAILEKYSQTVSKAYYVLGTVIFVLVVCLGVLLIGEQFSIIKSLPIIGKNG